MVGWKEGMEDMRIELGISCVSRRKEERERNQSIMGLVTIIDGRIYFFFFPSQPKILEFEFYL